AVPMVVVAVGQGGRLHPGQIHPQPLGVEQESAGLPSVQQIAAAPVLQVKGQAVLRNQPLGGGVLDQNRDTHGAGLLSRQNYRLTREAAVCFRPSTRASTSSLVLSGPKEMRSTPIRVRLGRPRAANTWLGLPLWQAEPEDTYTPRSDRARTSISLGKPGRDTAQMWGASPRLTISKIGRAHV